MNRRGFLAVVTALAVAPKAELVRRLPGHWTYRGPLRPCELFVSTEIKLSRADAERLAKIAGNFDKLKVPSYGQGGIVRPLHK